MKNGSFIISLDFELFWGLLDAIEYKENLQRIISTQDIALRLIEVFERNKISVSWATVGLLMLNDSEELSNLKNKIIEPSYENPKFNNYINYENLKKSSDFCEDVFFSKDIVEKIKKTNFQRIGTHTFSHYYCLEKGQVKSEFISDIELAKEVAGNLNLDIKSIVFPRNQYSQEHLEILKDQNITIFRGNPEKIIYKAKRTSNYIFKALRLIDTYINVSGNIIHPNHEPTEQLFDIKASRFLRPQNNTHKLLKILQLKRIKNEMTKAAKNNQYYHLWWHPHNFSNSIEENFKFLSEIIEHFKFLNQEYNFESHSMESYVEKVINYEENNYDMY